MRVITFVLMSMAYYLLIGCFVWLIIGDFVLDTMKDGTQYTVFNHPVMILFIGPLSIGLSMGTLAELEEKYR